MRATLEQASFFFDPRLHPISISTTEIARVHGSIEQGSRKKTRKEPGKKKRGANNLVCFSLDHTTTLTQDS